MAETVASLTAQIAAIDTAIALAEVAQSAGSRGTSISRANLATLYARRDTLQAKLETAEAAANGRSRMFSRGRVTGLNGY